MRRQRLLRAPSAQSVCIFCACSRFLIPDLQPIVLPAARRRLNTTRPPFQSAAAAQAQLEKNDNDNASPEWSGWDPNDSLSPAERAAKERRRQQQQRLAQTAAAAELSRQKQTEEARERDSPIRTMEQPPRDHGLDSIISKIGRSRGNVQRPNEGDTRRGVSRQSENENRNGNGSTGRRQQQAQVKRTAMPEFNAGATQNTEAVMWGTHAADIKPLKHREAGEEDQGQGVLQELVGGSSAERTQHARQDLALFEKTKSSGRDQARPETFGDIFLNPQSGQRASDEVFPPREKPQWQRPDEYRATMFDSADYRSSQPHYDPEAARNWQHLRPKDAAPPQPSPSHARRSDPPRWQNEDPDLIEQQFREHQQRRASRFQHRFSPQESNYSNPNIQTASQASTSPEFNSGSARQPRTCARCLEPGHTARECPGPVRAKCNHCGKTGHFANACPEKEMFQPRRGFGVRRGFNDVAHENDPFSFSNRVDGASGGVRDGAQTIFEPQVRESRERKPERSTEGHEETTFRPPARFGVEAQSASGVAQTEEEDPFARRRASRSARGFEDDTAPAVEEIFSDRKQRKNRRAFETRDEDADDEAMMLREERAAEKAARKAERLAEREARKRERGEQINLPEFISVSNLAQVLDVHYEHLIQRLERLGYEDIFPGKVLNSELSGMVAMEYNFDPIFESAKKTEEEERDLKARPELADPMYLPTRPPVVTIMGHVDHGKTTILDFLRKSSVAAGEAGGITQHIGAFSVPMTASGKTITFLDTPGHAAFLAMRQRGANVTDIVILVVAADDSVKPQTMESLRCAREAGVPIIVAINKVDKEEADVQRVKLDLSANGVEIEDFGGETQVVLVSGKTGQGMEELEEAIVTLSEILDHRAEIDGAVEGWVLEGTTKKSGRVATVLVKRGTLAAGDIIVAGKTWARVKTLRNEGGQLVDSIGPGMPVEVDGWKDQPIAGDEVLQAPSEQKASSVADYRIEKEERERTSKDMEAINEARRLEQEKRAKEAAAAAALAAASEEPPKKPTVTISDTPQEHGQLTIPFLIKADVSGSAEAVSAYIPSLTSPLITPLILSSAVGPVHESDIELAAAAQGHIIAFNLPPNPEMRGAAEARGVRVLENNIIYRVLDDVKEVLEAKLPPLISQRVLGEAEVGQKFEIGVGGRKKLLIAGCKVRNGSIGRGNRVKVMRGAEKVYDGTIDSLKNVKKDVQEMRKGSECGMGFDGWEEFEVGDLVQCYEEISEKRRL